MLERRNLTPWAVMALGAIWVAVGLLGVVGGLAGDALVGGGFVVFLAGALWHDVLGGRSLAEADRRDLLVAVLLVVGWGGYVAVTADPGLGRSLRVGVGLLGAVAVLGVGYLRSHRETVDSYDERQLSIRYRAAYNAFLAVLGLLFVGSFAVYLSTTAPGDAGPTYATAIVLGSAALMAVGVLTLKVSEGWYQTRM